MQDRGDDLIRRLHAEGIDRIRGDSLSLLSAAERPTIHWTDLREAEPNSPIGTEWEVYRREVGRLLSEGHEGRWVLIKGEQIIGIYETFQGAYEVALQSYLMQPVLIHQVRNREPILRIRGYNLPCRV